MGEIREKVRLTNLADTVVRPGAGKKARKARSIELEAVVEPRARVPEDRRAVDPCHEPVRSLKKWRGGGCVSSLQIVNELRDLHLLIRREGLYAVDQLPGGHVSLKYSGLQAVPKIRSAC